MPPPVRRLLRSLASPPSSPAPSLALCSTAPAPTFPRRSTAPTPPLADVRPHLPAPLAWCSIAPKLTLPWRSTALAPPLAEGLPPPRSFRTARPRPPDASARPPGSRRPPVSPCPNAGRTQLQDHLQDARRSKPSLPIRVAYARSLPLAPICSQCTTSSLFEFSIPVKLRLS